MTLEENVDDTFIEPHDNDNDKHQRKFCSTHNLAHTWRRGKCSRMEHIAI